MNDAASGEGMDHPCNVGRRRRRMSGAMSSLDWPAKGLSCPVLDDDGSELTDDDEGSENSESEVGSDGRIVAGLGIMVVGRA